MDTLTAKASHYRDKAANYRAMLKDLTRSGESDLILLNDDGSVASWDAKMLVRAAANADTLWGIYERKAAEEARPVCSNCGQWQYGAPADCTHRCRENGFA